MSEEEPVVEYDGKTAVVRVPPLRSKSDTTELLTDLGALQHALPDCFSWTIDLTRVMHVPLSLLGSLRSYQNVFEAKGGGISLVLRNRDAVAPSLFNSLQTIFKIESAKHLLDRE